MGAAGAGDRRPFAELFRRHQGRVFRHAAALLPQQADADAVTAAAFLELGRRSASVRLVHGSVLPWLLVTATKLARNNARGTRRYRALLDRLPRSAPQDPDVERERSAGRHPRPETPLGAALQTLRPADAALPTPTVLEGYSLREAAALLELQDSTARSDPLLDSIVLTNGNSCRAPAVS